MSGVHYVTGLIWLWILYFVIVRMSGTVMTYYISTWVIEHDDNFGSVTRILWLLPPFLRPYAERALPFVDRYLFGTPQQKHCHSEQEVYRTAVILSRKLDRDIVLEILDLAEMWADLPLATRYNAKRFHVCHPCPAYPNEKPSGTIYLSAVIPLNLPPRSLRSITCSVNSSNRSVDQRPNTMTRAEVGSWFDILMTSPDGTERARGPKVMRNPYEDGRIGTRSITWRFDDQRPLVAKLVQKMGGGWKVEIRVHTEAPWDNYVRSARVDMQMATIRRL